MTYPKVNLEYAQEILGLDLGVCQPGNKRLFEILGKLVPLKLYRYNSGREHNGWSIAHKWVVHKAEIKLNGKVIFDGKIHPLAVAGYSTSFQGSLSKTELAKHIFTRENLPEAYTYHCNNYYRTWLKDWGFCVPFKLWSSWPEGTYHIDLKTEYLEDQMLVGECHIQGQSDETIVFNAHTCHPAQFNDGFAGVFTIIALFQWLAKQNPYFSYRAVFAPEHIGTVFYCADLPEQELKRLKLGIFTEMTGVSQPLVLQESFTGNSLIDRIASHVLRQRYPHTEIGKFRTILGNDETVWEAPGIEIPFISLSRADKRFAFEVYHTNYDNLAANNQGNLDEGLEVLVDIVRVLENDRVMKRNFNGLIALSNPKYDLYIERLDPSVSKEITPRMVRLGALQDLLPRYFNGEYSFFDIAELHNLPLDEVIEYLNRFQEKGLVSLSRRSSISDYVRKSL